MAEIVFKTRCQLKGRMQRKKSPILKIFFSQNHFERYMNDHFKPKNGKINYIFGNRFSLLVYVNGKNIASLDKIFYPNFFLSKILFWRQDLPNLWAL